MILAPLLAPYIPNEIGLDFQAPPSAAHPLGTDLVGRDVLSRSTLRWTHLPHRRILVGRNLLYRRRLLGCPSRRLIAARAIASSVASPNLVGIVAPLVLILATVSLVGPSIGNVIWILGLLGWPAVFKSGPRNLLAVRESEMVEAARALGASSWHIAKRYLAPSAAGAILVAFTFGVGQAILTEAVLSYLGLGVQPPTSSWGNMLTDAESIAVLEQMPWRAAGSNDLGNRHRRPHRRRRSPRCSRPKEFAMTHRIGVMRRIQLLFVNDRPGSTALEREPSLGGSETHRAHRTTSAHEPVSTALERGTFQRTREPWMARVAAERASGETGGFVASVSRPRAVLTVELTPRGPCSRATQRRRRHHP